MVNGFWIDARKLPREGQGFNGWVSNVRLVELMTFEVIAIASLSSRTLYCGLLAVPEHQPVNHRQRRRIIENES